MKDQFLKLILVTNKSSFPLENYLDFISACAKGGITSVQLREKNISGSDLLQFGQRLKILLDSFHIPLIVNDSLDLCITLDAQGVHLGQTDGDIKATRKILGSQKIIGLTVNDLSQVELANSLPIDYIGVGAIFPTKNKPNIQRVWGLNALKQAASISIHPIVAVGGIDGNSTNLVIESGASGIAAIGAFHEAINPELTTQNLRKIVDGGFAS